MKHLRIKDWIKLIGAFVLIICTGCKSDENDTPAPYDPNLPVTISDFTPHEGGGMQRMIIYGSNFGIDPSIVSVRIGGLDAVVVDVKDNCLYCITPLKCYEGTVELKVGDSEYVKASEKYSYKKKRLVSTVCGYVDELGKGDVLDEGSFDEIEKILAPGFLILDPKNPDILYCVQDDGGMNNRPMLKFDLKNEYMTTVLKLPLEGVMRLKTIDFTPQSDSMVISGAIGVESKPSNFLFKRNANGDFDFKNHEVLTNSKGCQSSVVNRLSGDLYFTKFQDGTIWRYDFLEYGAGNNRVNGNQEQMFMLPANNSEINLVQHPTGNYMYILFANKHCILRSNFDRVTMKYTTPFIVAGTLGKAGYKDLIGTNARLNGAAQGVFVKNPKYIEEGRSDIYDFYFVERGNHCVRILTPDGVVSTFAGRGSEGVNGQVYGYIDGDLRNDARFYEPNGIAYDEKNDVFYISDRKNYRIRKISYEVDDEVNVDDENDEDSDAEDGEDNKGEDIKSGNSENNENQSQE